MIVQTTNEYGATPTTHYRLMTRRMIECQSDGEKSRSLPYSASRIAVKKVMSEKPRTNIDICYSLGQRYFSTEAWRSSQMIKIGCMIFRGLEYRKLRKWALA